MVLETTPNCSSIRIDSAMKQPLTSSLADGKNGVSVRTCSAGFSAPFDGERSFSRCAMSGLNARFHSTHFTTHLLSPSCLGGPISDQFRKTGDRHKTRILKVLFRKLHAEAIFDF